MKADTDLSTTTIRMQLAVPAPGRLGAVAQLVSDLDSLVWLATWIDATDHDRADDAPASFLWGYPNSLTTAISFEIRSISYNSPLWIAIASAIPGATIGVGYSLIQLVDKYHALRRSASYTDLYVAINDQIMGDLRFTEMQKQRLRDEANRDTSRHDQPPSGGPVPNIARAIDGATRSLVSIEDIQIDK